MSGEDSTKQTDLIVKLGEGADLFHSANETYATVQVNGHHETYRIGRADFKKWLTGAYYRNHGKAPGKEPLSQGILTLEAKASHDGSERPVAVRLAEHDGVYWLGLQDADWRCVRIDANGWEIRTESPVRFIRPPGVLALPKPVRGGSANELRDLVNVSNDDDWALILGWLIAAVRPVGPYPLLAVSGEPGSAKSTLCRILRSLVDPNKAMLRAEPKEARDLMIAAQNAWVLGFDNLSHLPTWLSDALCRLATGGGHATRQLYTDADEVIFEAKRPIVINGIPDLATRSDLADRTFSVVLPTIAVKDRRGEADLWKTFDEIRPRILGSLLDAVSAGLRELPSVKPANLPRMADAAMWVTAAGPSLGLKPGAFLAALGRDAEAKNAATLEASPIGPAILSFMRGRSHWTGTASSLLSGLETEPHSNNREQHERGWPKTASNLSHELRRLAPVLRQAGVSVEIGKRQSDRSRTRLIKLHSIRQQTASPVAPSDENPGDSDAEAGSDDADAMDDESATLVETSKEVEVLL